MNSIQKPESNQPLPPNATRVFKGVLFDVYQWPQKMFNGEMALYEKISRRDTVSVFPVTDDNKILLCRQEQPGTKPFIGSFGGQIDNGETPEAAARRELLEESGYSATVMQYWYAIQPIEKIDWAIYFFIAKGIEKKQAPQLDPGERIELMTVSFAEFLNLIILPEFRDKELTLDLLTAEKQGRLKEIEALFRL